MPSQPSLCTDDRALMLDLIGAYLDHLQVERGLSPHTVAAYRRDLASYANYLAAHKVQTPGEVDEQLVAGFAQHATRELNLAPASVARALVAVRSLHRFAVLEQITQTDPAADIHPPKLPARLPKALPIADVQRLLDTPNCDTPIGLRDAALLELLYGTGARITEIVQLDVDDLQPLLGDDADPDAGLRLLGKGNKERVVPLGSFAKTAVSAWLTRGRPVLAEARRTRSSATPSHTAVGEPALLLNQRGRRMSRQTAWAVLRATAAQAGVSEAISPHTLRHSYATHLLDGGADVRVVQELLGHASVTTTQIYTMVTVDYLRQVYRAAHPRAY